MKFEKVALHFDDFSFSVYFFVLLMYTLPFWLQYVHSFTRAKPDSDLCYFA